MGSKIRRVDGLSALLCNGHLKFFDNRLSDNLYIHYFSMRSVKCLGQVFKLGKHLRFRQILFRRKLSDVSLCRGLYVLMFSCSSTSISALFRPVHGNRTLDTRKRNVIIGAPQTKLFCLPLPCKADSVTAARLVYSSQVSECNKEGRNSERSLSELGCHQSLIVIIKTFKLSTVRVLDCFHVLFCSKEMQCAKRT